jgi:hypothetical protein
MANLSQFFTSGIKSVQRGSVSTDFSSTSSTSTSGNVTISSVNTSKAFLVLENSSTGRFQIGTATPNNNFTYVGIRASLSSATNIAWNTGTLPYNDISEPFRYNATINFNWQLIEFL